jgi:hypothetical protein
VYELFRLFLDCAYDLRMAMARGADGNAGIAIQKNIAIDIFHPDALPAFGD